MSTPAMLAKEPKQPRREAAKRDKYATRACNECQRRKVKCSGELPCLNCRNRRSSCKYPTGIANEADAPRRAPKRARRQAEENQTSDFDSDAEIATLDQSSPLDRPESAQSPSPTNKSQRGDDSLRSQVQQLQEQLNMLLRGKSLEYESFTKGTTAANDALSHRKLAPSLENNPRMSVCDGKAGELPANQQLTDTNDTDTASPSGETDTFESTSRWHSALAVSSKIRALRSCVGRVFTPTGQAEVSLPIEGHIFVTLPNPARLVYLLKVFFEEFDCNYPCLIEVNVRKKLSEAFRTLQYGKEHFRICVSAQEYKTVAILCNALAYGDSAAEPSVHQVDSPSEVRPGWALYLQGRQLMQHTDISGTDDTDVITYHVTSAAYTLRAEMLRLASNHVLRGFQAALNASLNNQDGLHTTQLEFASRKALWWTLYFLDKRIAQKSGIAYFIRESEVAVGDFRGGAADGPGDKDNDGLRRELLQNMIVFSKLWTHIWDHFFAPEAPKAGVWDEVQFMDARIMVFQQQTPTRLLWTPALVDELVRNGETEPQIRKRLLVYLRYQVLRLSIRHGSLASSSAERQRRRSGFYIAQEIVESVAKYMSLYATARGSGYLLTSSLVEALYYIVPEHHRHPNSLDPQIVLKTLRKASNLLHTLSQYVGSANRALNALRCVLLLDESIPADLFSANEKKQGLAAPRTSLPSSVPHVPETIPDQVPGLPENFWIHEKAGEAKNMPGGVGDGGSAGAEQWFTFSAAMGQELEQPTTNRAPTRPIAPNYHSLPPSDNPFPTFGLESRPGGYSNDLLFNLDSGWGLNERESLDYFHLDFQ